MLRWGVPPKPFCQLPDAVVASIDTKTRQDDKIVRVVTSAVVVDRARLALAQTITE